MFDHLPQRLILFTALLLTTTILAQTTYVYEYDTTDSTCSAASPVRAYTIGTTCQRGPVPNRFGYATCSSSSTNQSSTFIFYNCLDCGSVTSCTLTTFGTQRCISPTQAPSGRFSPYIVSCTSNPSVTTSPPITYTEYQDSTCQIPIRDYNQTQTGCVDNENWSCGLDGVNYAIFTQSKCTGSITSQQYIRLGFCSKIKNDRFVKVTSCRRSMTNGSFSTTQTIGLYQLGIFLGILILTIGFA